MNDHKFGNDYFYSDSHWDEVRGVGVEPTGGQGALSPAPLYSIDMKTATAILSDS